jgi:hypothetical protein
VRDVRRQGWWGMRRLETGVLIILAFSVLSAGPVSTATERNRGAQGTTRYDGPVSGA